MDRLADRSLSGAMFAQTDSVSLPRKAAVVVVGGGIVGSSIAYHLTQSGVDDVLLVERNLLTSGTTWHAAGLIANARGSIALTEMAQYGPEFYSTLESASGINVGFTRSGSVSVARSAARVDEFTHAADIAHHCGVTAQLLSAEAVAELWPLASMEGVAGGLFFPDDGYVNPGYASIAMAKLASGAGALIRENVHVRDILTKNGRIVGISTDAGAVEADVVVLAGGLWSRDLAATAGVHLPLYAAEHVHVRSEPIPANLEGLPVLRDVDNSYYLRREGDRLLLGAFEPRGIPRSTDDID
jgi:4-methylaminobutanoate oxidase (formaldehyde-forming)